MKKLILTTVAVSAVAMSAFSQGFVVFSGGGNVATRLSTNAIAPLTPVTAGQAVAVANSYYLALFASASATAGAGNGAGGISLFQNGSVAAGWTLVGIAGNIASLGRYSGLTQGSTSAGQAPLNADNSMTVQGIAGGSVANLIAVGWSAAIGNNLAAALAWYGNAGAATPTLGWIGQSTMSTQTLGDGGSIPTPTTWNAAPTFMLGQINPIPEPGTLALAALGGASLLLFRRKK